MMDGSLMFNAKMCLPPQHLMPYQSFCPQTLLPSHEAPLDTYAILVSRSSSSTSSRSCSAQSSPENKSEDDCPIGYGAFGVVWAVTDPRLNKRVALKKISNIFQSLVACRRVFRELSLLTAFRHDNIIAANDIVFSRVDNNELYVLTELMQSDLHKIISSSQPLSLDHIKLFLYQLLRGLKYLHSSNIIHRDIKPGNLLLNADCKLKICDFGLARVVEADERQRMTQEVVTQYYRAPEVLMGAKHYTTAVDMWSVGCIMAELLSRRVLFQANSPIQQLDLIVSILGTPSMDEMAGTCQAAQMHIIKQPICHQNVPLLRSLSKEPSHKTLLFLLKLLSFSPRQRLSAEEALTTAWVDEGRLRFHTSICSCCRVPYCCPHDLEPSCPKPFPSSFEQQLYSISVVKSKLMKLYRGVQMRNEAMGVSQLHLNPYSPAYKAFSKSQCAQVNELPPSPYLWE